jgi:DNA-binding NtrC family response regulator
MITTQSETDPGATMTVLVVEDEVLIRLDLADRLRAEGYTVVEASNGDEALVVMNTVSTVALIISDVRMPGKTDGVGLAALVKQRSPQTKVVLISGHLPASSMAAIADVALTKPVNPPLLIQHVKALLGKPTD